MVNAHVAMESEGRNVTDAFTDSGECQDLYAWHTMDVNVRPFIYLDGGLCIYFPVFLIVCTAIVILLSIYFTFFKRERNGYVLIVCTLKPFDTKSNQNHDTSRIKIETV